MKYCYSPSFKKCLYYVICILCCPCSIFETVQEIKQTTPPKIFVHQPDIFIRSKDLQDSQDTMCDFHNFGLIFVGQCTVCPKAKINFFWNFFEWSSPEGASGVKKKFQKTLIFSLWGKYYLLHNFFFIFCSLWACWVIESMLAVILF